MESIIFHPEFDASNTNAFDFSLIKLSTPVMLLNNPNVGIVCLPDDDSSDLFDGVDLTVSGWGSNFAGGAHNPKLKAAFVNRITNKECQHEFPSNDISDYHICAVGGSKPFCHGNDGGFI